MAKNHKAVEIMETDALPLVIDADYVAVRNGSGNREPGPIIDLDASGKLTMVIWLGIS